MKPILRPISDQVVVLFGATSGIGLETAMHMVEKGARVAIIGRNQEGLNDALEQVRVHAAASKFAQGHSNGNSQATAMEGGFGSVESGGSPVGTMEDQVIALEADVTNWEEVRSVAEQVNMQFGRIDTWVNVVGVSEWALFEETTPEEFRRIIDVNLVGHAYGAMAALPYLKQQGGGALIFVSSIAGRLPIPYQAAYNASKHGLMGLIDTLRLEMKHTGVPVSVTAILPASINTPLFNKARTKLGVEPEPIPPIYDAKLVAKAILHAAQHPVRELMVGDAGYVMTFMRRLAPTTTNNLMGVMGFRKQRSDEPKSALAPDNLYHHVSGYNEVDGEFTPRTMGFSPLTWLATHPRARLGLTALLIAGLGFFIGSRIVHDRSLRHRRFSYRARKMGHRVSHFGHEAGVFLTGLPLISNLPWFQRKSWLQKLIALLPALPALRRKPTLAERLPLPRRHKSLSDRLPLQDQRKAIADKLPTAKSLKHSISKIDVASKLPMVERRQTFSEHYEAVVEKMPFRK